jgi:hypothetical protein
MRLRSTPPHTHKCERRHSKSCRYFRRGKCWINETYVYLHGILERKTVNNVCEEIIVDAFDNGPT